MFDLEVYAKYESPTSTSADPSTLLAALISTFSLGTGGTGLESQAAADAFNAIFDGGVWIDDGMYDPNAPRAYLNYILFDEEFIPVDFGFDQVTEAGATAHELLSLHVKVAKKGYLYVYLSNEQPVQTNVYFDDFRIVRHTGVVGADDYYPFGLTYNSYRRENSTPQDHKFNGKEEQTELGLSWLDFGRRMYQPELGRFFTEDRFAEKYYSMTPYQYGANNPMLYIDVNGDSLWISHRTGFLGLGKRENVLYENGSLYNKDGSAYTGKVKGYLKQAKGALDQVNGVSSGQGLLRQLEGSDFNFTITKGSNEFVPDNRGRAALARNAPAFAAMAGSGGTVYWKPGNTTGGPNQLGNTTRPAFLGLAHELGHGSMAERGMSDYSTFAPGHADPALRNIANDEYNAVHVENQIRSEYGIPLREFYTRDAAGAGFMRFLAPATVLAPYFLDDFFKRVC